MRLIRIKETKRQKWKKCEKMDKKKDSFQEPNCKNKFESQKED